MAEKTKDIQKKEMENVDQAERTRSGRIYTPNVDIIERKNDILLLADMPAADESSIDITLEKNVLTIYAKVNAQPPENMRLIQAGYGIGDYQRSFTLSDEIDREKIKATMKDGVLNLLLPKAAPAKTKKIAVEVGA
jgi:HSP20 family molecular chaperone IbpA